MEAVGAEMVLEPLPCVVALMSNAIEVLLVSFDQVTALKTVHKVFRSRVLPTVYAVHFNDSVISCKWKLSYYDRAPVLLDY